MKILFLSRWFPYPMDNGSKLRIFNLLRGLSRHHDVSLLSFADQPGVHLEAPQIGEICSQASVVPWREFNPHTLRARLATFGLKPRSIVDTFSSEMARAITKTLNEQKYDLIIASQLQMAAYYPYFRGIPAVFEEVEIGLFHDQAFSADGKIRVRQALTWFKLRIYFSWLLGAFQACTVASKGERQLLRKNFPGYRKSIEIIPNCLDVSGYENINANKRDNTLIFTGSFRYRANYEAMLWFVGEVFPLIVEQVPDARLFITGDHANQPLPSVRNVNLAGHVEDIKSLIASCSVSIAPLLSGGGTRLKILEAMALGVPVVATSKGAEGLDVNPGQHLFISDDPGKFATTVMNLLSDPELRRDIASNAKQLVREKYDWKEVLPCFQDLLNRIVYQ